MCRGQNLGKPQLALRLRQDMVYFSGAEGSPAYNKAREFSQKISTVGVDGRNKESWLFLWGVREREVAGVTSLFVHDPLES